MEQNTVKPVVKDMVKLCHDEGMEVVINEVIRLYNLAPNSLKNTPIEAVSYAYEKCKN